MTETIVSAMYRDGNDTGGTIYLIKHDDELDVTEAIRSAAEDFLDTEEGHTIAATNGVVGFNWGDALTLIDAKTMAEYGIHSFEDMAGSRDVVFVDHDETLVQVDR